VTYTKALSFCRHKKGTILVVNVVPHRLAANVFGPIRRFRVGTNKEQEHKCLSASSCSGRAQKTNDGALGFSLLKRDRLGIRIQCDSAGRVTKEFLHHLDIRSVCSQQRRIRVPEGVPSDVLCDADLSRCWANDGSHERLSPIRSFSMRSSAGEHPVIGGPITGVLAPRMQRLGQTWVKWNRLL